MATLSRIPAPRPDPLVERLFAAVLSPPDGYDYHIVDNQILFPVVTGDKWRLLLRKMGTDQLTPVFIEQDFIVKLMRALNAMQRELNSAVDDTIPEPVKAQVQ